MDEAGQSSCPAAAAATKHRLITSERIAHPLQMSPFPHIPDQCYFGSSGYPLRIEAGLARA
jgi:hypothetical protein